MAQVLAYDALDGRIEPVDRVHRVAPPRVNVLNDRGPEGNALNRLDKWWSDEPKSAAGTTGFAVIVMVGTTPHDEDAIALELRREGLQVVASPAGAGRKDSVLQPGGLPDDDRRRLVNRLLGAVDRRLHGALHATAWTVDQPGSSGVGSPGSVLAFGRLSIDYARREVLVDSQEIPLSKSEFGLLYLLAVQAGRVFTRTELVARGKRTEYPVTERSIDVHIAAIRRKLGSARGHVQTVRGVGYRFHESPRSVHE
jgi:DNA-binding winged helix-turn-helix (wHTH) protein